MDRFGVDEPDFELAPRYNLAPSQDAPVVGVNPKTPETRSLRLMHWGLVPYRAKDAAKPVINARAETLAQRPAFRDLLPRRRCLVPADGFYEWRKEGRIRTPMRFTLRSGEPFAFAGLWDRWVRPDGAPLYSFTIVTTSPNSLLEPVHNRMPVILLPEDESRWLDPANTDPAALAPLLKPYPAELMDGYCVSRAVNSPVNDSPECIASDEAQALLRSRHSQRPHKGVTASEFDTDFDDDKNITDALDLFTAHRPARDPVPATVRGDQEGDWPSRIDDVGDVSLPTTSPRRP